MNKLKMISKLSLMIFLLNLLSSCSQTPISQIDRSRLNSKIMSADTFSAHDTTSPHTGLRSKGGTNSGGCSVCAH